MAPKMAYGPVGTGNSKGRPQDTKVTVGGSRTPFAAKAPAGKTKTGQGSSVNRDSIKGVSQTPRGTNSTRGASKAKRKAIAAMPNSPGLY